MGESVEHFETLRQTKDGRLITVSVTASPIKDASGKPIGVSKVARDITERKQAEQARLALEERYRALFEYAPDGILIADPESRYLDANPSVCRMLGYSREELVGMHATDIVVPSEANFIQAIEERQGLKIGSPEETAFRMGYIDRTRLLECARSYPNSPYGAYLERLATTPDL